MLDLDASVLLLETEDGHFLGSHRVDVQRGQLAGQRTPALWVSGRDDLDTERGVRTWGKLGAAEQGASLAGSYDVRLPTQRESSIGVDLAAKLEDPARLAELGVRAAGTASVSAQLYPERRALSAKASVSLRHVEQAVLQARNLEARAELSGGLTNPHLRGAATADLLSGRVHADLDYSNDNRALDLFAADLDLVRLAHVLGQKVPLERGTLGLDAHIRQRAPSRVYSLDATADVDAGKVGSLKLRAAGLELPAGAASATQLGALRGELTANGAVDLEAVSPLLTAAGLPIERTTGRVRFEVTARHRNDDAQGLELAAQLDTNGLRVVQERRAPDGVITTSDAIASKPIALEGIDVHFSAHAWPQNGDVVGTLILRDAGGTLLETQAEAELGPGFEQGALGTEALSRLPFKATLEMPRRRLGSLPGLVRPAALRGRLAFDASFQGNLLEPHVLAQISAQGLRTAGSKVPVDVQAEVAYEPAGGKVSAKAFRPQSTLQVGGLDVNWQGDLRAAARAHGDDTGITANAEVMLRDFPLDVVPQITDRQVAGQLSGDLELKDWGRDAQLEAKLSSTTLAIGKVAVPSMMASLQTKADKLSAELMLQVGSGRAHATLERDMVWGRRPLPQAQQRGVAKLETHAFRLETLSPLLSAYVSEIGGVLDASTELVVTPGATALSGSATLEHGVVQLPAIGQRFSDISAHVAVADNQFKLERLQARGTTGRLSAKATARLDGFEVRGADAHVVINKNESLPLTLEGAEIGDAWGSVNAQYTSPERGERKLQIDVPDFHLLAPETGSHGLQSLDQDREIRVGVRRADGAFVPLPIQPLQPGGKSSGADAEPAQPLRIVVKLGNVSVERGRSAQAQLTGQLAIEVARQTEVQGRIEVRGGKLDVQGKTFEIERGVVTFEGDDPGNPTITATARWDAPGYSVYADYLGDVKNGRIKLHAEPPLTQDEIASLLLFGSPEGSPSNGTDSNAALAVSVAGNTAAKGLNQVLDDFTKLDVSARVDTTTGSARPELVFQVSPRVSAKVTRAVGAPAAGESPDRTFLTLELRLRRAWALSAILGDHGASALDLIWRRRY
jgi:autotransporter translocation and assembly factor TamB